MRAASILRTVLLASLATGCFAVVDVDRFKQGTASNSQFQDLRFRIEQATSHVTNYFEYRVVDSNNVIRSRGIVDPLVRPDVDIHAPKAVPTQGQFRLDFYADKSQQRTFNGLGPGQTSAHAWRIEPLADYPPPGDPNDGVFDVHYVHDTNFTELTNKPATDLGFAFKMTLRKMTPYQGKLVQVRVSDAGTGQTLGVYRFPQLSIAEPSIVIPGIILDLNYTIDVYADANGNGAYDNPASGGDHGWRTSATGNGAELVVSFDPDATPKNIDVGIP